MVPSARPVDQAAETTARLRHRRVPARVVGAWLIVARPHDGAVVRMTAEAALVWHQLDDWTTPTEIDRHLAEVYPQVAEQDRLRARTEILQTLQDDDLLESC